MATREQLIEDFADHKLATGEKFVRLINSTKAVQEPVVDPAASGTSLSFIDSISQDADGKITATKKTLDLANAHELNPFKGWYKTGDTLPTDGFDGAYLYFKDTSEQTGLTTIYRWNGTTYADTGTVVDTSNVNTFETGQALNGTGIKDLDGNNDTSAAGVLSAAAGKALNEQLYGYLDMTLDSDAIALPTTPKGSTYQNTADGNNAWYVGGIARSSGVIDLRAYKDFGYKYLKVTMNVNEPNVHGGGYLTFVKRLDTPQAATSFNDLVSGGYLSSVHDAPNKVCINTPSNNSAELTTNVPIPDDAIGVLFQYRDLSGSSSQSITYRKPKEVKYAGKHANGDVDNIKDGLRQIVVGGGVEVSSNVDGIIISSENIYQGAAAPAGASFFEIEPGKKYSVVPQGGKSAIIAILQNIDNVSRDSTPAFSSNYGGRIMLGEEDSFEFVCPKDAHYMYMLHNPSSESYGLAKVFVASELSMLEDGIYKPISYRMTLERGVLFGGHASNGKLYYNGCVPFGNYGLDNSYWQCTFNYIAAMKSVVVVGLSEYILYEFDEGFNFVKQTFVEDGTADIELSEATMYIKLSTPNAATEVATEWVQGGLGDGDGDTPRADRIKTTVAVNSFNYISYGDGMVLYFEFCDANMNKIGIANGIRGCRVIPKSAVMASFVSYNDGDVNNVAYIRLSLGYNNNENISTDASGVLSVCTQANEPLKTVTINTCGVDGIVKNDATPDKTINIVYPVMANDGSQQYSKMLVRFPSSYSNQGVPTKVIVFKTGSSGFRYLTTEEHFYIQQLQYWVDMGYAVMDFHGATSKYPNDDSFGSPTQLSSAAAAWRWLCDHYNVQSDWCYLASKSLGGVLGHLIAQNKVLPVRAYAALASTPTNTTYCFGYYADFRQHFCEDAGLELTAEEEAFMATPAVGYIPIENHNSDTFRGILTKNILNGKLRGYLPMYNLTLGLSASDFAALDAETANTFANVTLVCQVPYRHWVASDDIDVPLKRIANYVSEVQNAGAPATLRVMPAGQGKHHAVDNAPNAPQVENVTTRLGVFYARVPLAYVEALRFLEVH